MVWGPQELSVGSCEAECRKKTEQSKTKVNQLTLSLDYIWNEERMIKKEEGGWQNKKLKGQTEPIIKLHGSTTQLKGQHSVYIKIQPTKASSEEMSGVAVTGCGVEGRDTDKSEYEPGDGGGWGGT